ncbi:MAG: hypothetical protein WCJ58_01745 [bacterium]
MKIYVTHSSAFDYKTELYQPLRDSELNTKYEIILPHEHSLLPMNSKEQMTTFDIILAEISYASTGQGIELGWADFLKKPIIAFYQNAPTIKPSSSVATLTEKIFKYENSTDLISKLRTMLKYY